MKISISLDVSSVEDAISKVEDYQKGLELKCEELASKLAAMGGVNVSLGFARAIYDGTADANVEVVQVNPGQYKVTAKGETVFFQEFGAGVYHPDNYPPLPKNANVPDLVGRGQYGKGYGSRKTWAYRGKDAGTNGWTNPKRPGWIFTHGNPANMPMYNTAMELKNAIISTAKEVFRT